MHVTQKAELYITDDNTVHPQEADKTDQFFVGKADNQQTRSIANNI